MRGGWGGGAGGGGGEGANLDESISTRAHECPRLVEFDHGLRIGSEDVKPLMQKLIVEAAAHKGAEFDVWVVGGSLGRE